jgi:hypothetical protein
MWVNIPSVAEFILSTYDADKKLEKLKYLCCGQGANSGGCTKNKHGPKPININFNNYPSLIPK